LAYAGLPPEQEAVRAGLHITTLLQAYTKYDLADIAAKARLVFDGLHITTLLQAYTKYDLADIAAKARLVFDTRVEMVAESVYPL
jgi:hypothetical protein